ISERSTLRLQTGQNKGCLRREWHSLWSWLKLIRSPRAAVDMRTGIEIRPNVRWPFQTVVAISTLLRQQLVAVHDLFKVIRPPGKKQDAFMPADAHFTKWVRILAPVGTVTVRLLAVAAVTVAAVPLNCTVLALGVVLKFCP